VLFPYCGLVQIPCIERNAVAAVRAMNACNLSYFLTGSRRISYDMVCRAMKETGVNLDHPVPGNQRRWPGQALRPQAHKAQLLIILPEG